MCEPSLMTAAGNKYELPGVTDLVRGFLLNGGVNRVPCALRVCILYEHALVIRIHINADGMPAPRKVYISNGIPPRGEFRRDISIKYTPRRYLDWHLYTEDILFVHLIVLRWSFAVDNILYIDFHTHISLRKSPPVGAID